MKENRSAAYEPSHGSRQCDIRAALVLLSDDAPALTPSGSDPRWPDLSAAIHWLVDDTWWDHGDPAEDVGVILRSETEAAAIRQVVEAIVGVHDRQGAQAPDSAWYGGPEWQQVVGTDQRPDLGNVDVTVLAVPREDAEAEREGGSGVPSGRDRSLDDLRRLRTS